jgi:hypothetical protein
MAAASIGLCKAQGNLNANEANKPKRPLLPRALVRKHTSDFTHHTHGHHASWLRILRRASVVAYMYSVGAR